MTGRLAQVFAISNKALELATAWLYVNCVKIEEWLTSLDNFRNWLHLGLQLAAHGNVTTHARTIWRMVRQCALPVTAPSPCRDMRR